MHKFARKTGCRSLYFNFSFLIGLLFLSGYAAWVFYALNPFGVMGRYDSEVHGIDGSFHSSTSETLIKHNNHSTDGHTSSNVSQVQLSGTGTQTGNPIIAFQTAGSIQGGSLLSWGLDDWRLGRQLSDSSEPKEALLFLKVISVAASRHTLVATEEGHVYSMGLNDSHGGGGHGSQPMDKSGQLGRDGWAAPGRVGGKLLGKFVVKVATGRYHSVAVTNKGEVYTWGLNDWGQLGRAGMDFASPASASCMSGPWCHSAQPGKVLGLTGITIIDAVAGRYSTAVIDTKGRVYIWGMDGCATGSRPLKTTAWRLRIVAGDLLGRKIVSMSIGYTFWIASDDKGSVFTCSHGDDGYGGTLPEGRKPNAAGELGRPGDPFVPKVVASLANVRVVSVAAGREHALVATDTGEVWSWGGGRLNVLGRQGSLLAPGRVLGPLAGIKILKVAAGEYSSLAASLKMIYGWGNNDYGNLGVRNIPYQSKGGEEQNPIHVQGLLNQNAHIVTALVGGYQHTLAIVSPDVASKVDAAASKLEAIAAQKASKSALAIPLPPINMSERWEPEYRILYAQKQARSPTTNASVLWSRLQPLKFDNASVEAMPDVFGGLPKAFDPSLKNPCWRKDRSRQSSPLLCLPYFQVIGVSKCGTTDLYHRLVQHPHVYEALNKGPHWWDECPFPPMGECTAPPGGDFMGYVNLFSKAAERIAQDPVGITGEASSNTFTAALGIYVRGFRGQVYPSFNVSLPKIFSEAIPWTRYILMLRNPVERYHSAFYYYRWWEKDKPIPSPDDFHNQVVDDLAAWEKCTVEFSVDSCVRGYVPQQLVKGLYVLFLADWQMQVAGNQMMIIRFEDYKMTPRAHMAAVFKFLGLPQPSEEQWSGILDLPPKNRNAYPAMRADTHKMLEEFYSIYNVLLSERLNDQRWLWNDTVAKASFILRAAPKVGKRRVRASLYSEHFSYLQNKVLEPQMRAPRVWALYQPSAQNSEIVRFSRDVFEPLPKWFSADFSTPCWRGSINSSVASFNCLPYFQVIGVPHAGAKDLFYRLARHPKVIKSASEDVNWWALCSPQDPSSCGSFQAYAHQASSITEVLMTDPLALLGELATDTFTSALGIAIRGRTSQLGPVPEVTLPMLLRDASPWSRFIVLLRDPVERYQAAFYHTWNKSAALLDNGSALHTQVVGDLKLWHECVTLHALPKCLRSNTPQRLVEGMYAFFLEDWRASFPDQLLLLRYEDYLSAPAEHLEAVFSFLGLVSPSTASWRKVLDSPIMLDSGVTVMRDDTRQLLTSFYHTYNTKLVSILADPRWNWSAKYCASNPCTAAGGTDLASVKKP